MAKNLIIKQGSLRKASSGEPGEGPSFEQQFGILANAQITDKYPSLSNYQIAVQMLDKSEDNSFAACVVVYKLGSNYIYVPAVFRKGKISTGEFMEVPALQMFLPLSDAWLSWIKNKDDKGEAQTVDPSEASMYGKPPGTARAREPIDPLLKNASAQECFEAFAGKTPSILETALKLGKKASHKMMDMLCKEGFLNEAFKFYSPQDILEFSKKASTQFPDEPEVEMISVFDKKASELTDAQKALLFRDGYVFKKASKVDWGDSQNDIKVVQHRDVSHQFSAPVKSCKCKLLQPGGELKEASVVFARDVDKLIPDSGDIYAYKYSPGGEFYVTGQKYMKHNSGNQAKTYVIADGAVSSVDFPVTAVTNTVEDLDISSLGKAFTSTSKEDLDRKVLFVCPSGEAFEAYDVKDRKDGDIFGFNRVYRISQDEDLKSPICTGRCLTFPKGTRVVPVNNKPVDLVSVDDLGRTIEQFLLKNSTKVKMTSDGHEISFSGPASKPAQRFIGKQAALHLVKDYGVAPQDAKTMIKMAGTASLEKPLTFTFQLYKEAAQDDFEDSPKWKPADISMSEHPENPPQITQEDLQNKAMEDQKELDTITRAADSGVKEVFDTETLKLLMQDADPHTAILQAVPDLMRTLDKLCQMLFLYRCHMQDMEERYGAVKMKALEKALQNTIKDLSELTIFIKLRGLNNGQTPDNGDLQTGTMLQ